MRIDLLQQRLDAGQVKCAAGAAGDERYWGWVALGPIV
jgi:hypothetical protein